MLFGRWQLTPFLVCACSILLVASKLHTIHNKGANPECKDRLEADATSCLLVLDILGASSDAATHAARMLRALQNNGVPVSSFTDTNHNGQTEQAKMASTVSHFRRHYKQFSAADHTLPLSPSHNVQTHMPTLSSNATPLPLSNGRLPDSFEQWQEWPHVDYFDSLMWSSQFVLPADAYDTSWDLGGNVNQNYNADQSQQDHGH